MNLRKQTGSLLESYPLVKKHIFRKKYYDITKEMKSVENRYIKIYGDNPSVNIKLFRRWFIREYGSVNLDKL